MELARVLGLVCLIASSQLVRGTPHGYGGYGVKGGAAAKAQAAAGAFAGAGAIPIPFPLSGAGYSGSYSKSSSSSFASSGASSSSFSFSGSGLPGIGGGCTTCPNAQPHDGIHASNSNDFYSNYGANGADAAQAGSLAGSQYYPKENNASPCSGSNCNQKGTGCKGPDCNNFPSSANKCESGQCEPTSSEPLDSNNEDKDKKCAYGQCGADVTSNVQATNFASGNNNLNSGDSYSPKCTSGDCKANGGTETSSPQHNPSDKGAGQFGSSPTGYGSNAYPNKCTSGNCEGRGDVPPDYGSNNPNKCAYGKCEGRGDVPPDYGSNNPNKCAYGKCGDLGDKPTHDAPYDKSEKCTSGQCKLTPTADGPSENSDDIPVNFAGKPNAPSGTGIFPTSKPGVTPYSTTNSYSKPNYSNQNKDDSYPHALASGSASAPTHNKPVPFLTAPKVSSSCTSPNCQRPNVATVEYPYGYVVPGSKPSHGSSPGVSGQSPSSSILPGTQPTTGSYPNVPGTNPSNPIESAAYPGTPSSSSLVCAGANCAKPQYTSSNSGYGGLKCTTPNCASTNPQLPSPHILTPNEAPYYNNANNVPHAPTSPGSPLTHSQGYNPNSKPSIGFGAPTRPSYQNDLSGAHPQGTVQTRPNYASTGTSTPESHNSNDDGSIPPFVPLDTSKSPNCIGNNCAGVTNQPSYGQNSVPTHPAPVNPSNYGQNSVLTHPGPTSPGQSSGIRPSYGHNPVPTHVGPAHSGHPTSPGGATYPGIHSTVSSNAGAHPDKPEKPYLGGFGGPSGLLKPNEFNLPSNTLPSINNKPSPGSPPCLTGSCSPQPNPSSPGYAGASNPVANHEGAHNNGPCTSGKCGSLNGPSGNYSPIGAHAAADSSVPSLGSSPCSTGNCNPQPNPSPGYGGASNPNANHEGTHSGAPCTTGKCGSPNGPSGNYNPNGAHAAAGSSVPSLGSPPCSTGNCNPQNNPSSSGHGVASNPITNHEGTHNGAPCTTGKCGSPNGQPGSINLNGAHAAAGAVATASAGAYTGGFGGPPGLLAPFDSGKLDGSVPSKIGGFPTGASGQSLTNGGHSAYNHGAGGGALAGAGAQATAVAGASAGAISGSPYGHGANGGHGTSGGCDGGCGGSYGGGRSLDINAPSHLKDSLDGLYGGAAAAAKAGAASFGSSFASAHASAGAAVKGGHYGRR